MSTYHLIHCTENAYMMVVDEKFTSSWNETLEELLDDNFKEYDYRQELKKPTVTILHTFTKKPTLDYMKTHYPEYLI